MSQKRKFEEYHDPDYPKNDNNKIAKLSAESNVKQIDKKKRISEILTCEFDKEINNKEREVYEINHRIILVRKMLHKVCFAVITNYYNKRNLNLAPEEVAQAQESISRLFTDETKGFQNAIHPSLKKILGSNEVNYKELLNSRPTRQAAKTAQSTIKEKFKTKKEMRIERLRIKALESIQENVTVDESSNQTTIVKESLSSNDNQSNNIRVSPQRSWDKLHKLNTDKGINLSRLLIAVGNTSKFIQKENLLDKVTHKWLIYVQSKTETPIEKFVKKVRFYLHPSYKPNDIVDVDCTPFQLARRGWGEFPVRIQLYFHSKFQQKPVQFYHNLVLDKTLTGLQTIGSETLVELWLRSILFSPQKQDLQENICENYQYYPETNQKNYTEEETSNNNKKGKSISPITECKDNLIDFLNQIDHSFPTDPDSIEPTLILSPTTHTKLKISDAINSPIIQNSCNYNMLNKDNTIFKNDDIIATIKLEKPDIYFEKHDTNYYDNIKIEKQTQNSSFCESTFQKPQINLPLSIKKINDKLKQTITSESGVFSISDNCIQSNLHKQNFDYQAKDKVEQNNNINCHIKQKNQIILKDGKVSIIDPYQTKSKKRRKQISLLKPVIKQNQFNVKSIKRQNFKVPWLIDHDYTSPWKDEINSELKPISGDIENENTTTALDILKDKLGDPGLITSDDFISVVISDNTKQLINLKRKITLTVKEESLSSEKPFIDYRGQFELKFHSKKFATENDLIEYCLKNVPLIDSKASDSHYKTAFPFVLENLVSLSILLLPKRRALEWLQCKYFSTLMQNHDQFPETSWSTKEIILYARSYGYSPTQFLCGKSVTDNKDLKNINLNDHDRKLGQLIEEIYEWINEYSKNQVNDQNADKINIDDENDDHLDQTLCKKLSPLKYDQNSIIIPIEERLVEESKLIKEICDRIKITLKPEPVSQNVNLHVSELILIKLFQKFSENLIRKSIFEAKNTNEPESIPVVEIEHVKNALLFNPEFEFLTSKSYKNISEIKKELS